MDLLPHDILVRIANSVSAQDQASLHLVCKGLRDAVEDAEVSLKPNGDLSPDVIVEACIKFPRATSLDLTRCKMESLPEALPLALPALKILNLSGTSRLKSLPESLGSLKDLVRLEVGHTGLTVLPSSLSGLSSLEKLSTSACQVLKELPEGLGSLSQLEILDLIGCSSLKALPDSITALFRLWSLTMRGCPMVEALPEGFGALTALQTL